MNYNYYQNPNNGYSFPNYFPPPQRQKVIYPQSPAYYHPYGQNPGYFQQNYPPIEQNLQNPYFTRTKSVDNLLNHGENTEKVQIGDRIKLTNKQSSPETSKVPANNPKIIENETSSQWSAARFDNPKSFSAETIQNTNKYTAFSNEFLSKQAPILKAEEDVLSEDSKKNSVQSPLPIKISQRQMNEKLIVLETKKQEFEALIAQNSSFNSQYKLLLENKAKIYVVEKLLEENQKLNAALSSKMVEIAKLAKNSREKYEKGGNFQAKTAGFSPKDRKLESCEVKNLELKTELKETELSFIKKLYLLRKCDEQTRKLANLRGEIQIKELTASIQRLTAGQNSQEDKKSEVLRRLFVEIEELFQKIKREFQKT